MGAGDFMSINLKKYGIRLFYCQMILHDYLWFASYDASSLASTEAVIHNFALSYAVSRFDRSIMHNDSPRYDKDLAEMDFYAMPAQAIEYKKITQTYNALDAKSWRTDELKAKKNTPKLGKKNMITPLSKFDFYLYSWGKEPAGIIRLGKKRSQIRLKWREIYNPVAYFNDDSYNVDHIVNPLDVSGKVQKYEIVRIPPFLLLKNVELKNDWYIEDKNKEINCRKRIVHLPEKILTEVGD